MAEVFLTALKALPKSQRDAVVADMHFYLTLPQVSVMPGVSGRGL